MFAYPDQRKRKSRKYLLPVSLPTGFGNLSYFRISRLTIILCHTMNLFLHHKFLRAKHTTSRTERKASMSFCIPPHHPNRFHQTQRCLHWDNATLCKSTISMSREQCMSDIGVGVRAGAVHHDDGSEIHTGHFAHQSGAA